MEVRHDTRLWLFVYTLHLAYTITATTHINVYKPQHRQSPIELLQWTYDANKSRSHLETAKFFKYATSCCVNKADNMAVSRDTRMCNPQYQAVANLTQTSIPMNYANCTTLKNTLHIKMLKICDILTVLLVFDKIPLFFFRQQQSKKLLRVTQTKQQQTWRLMDRKKRSELHYFSTFGEFLHFFADTLLFNAGFTYSLKYITHEDATCCIFKWSTRWVTQSDNIYTSNTCTCKELLIIFLMLLNILTCTIESGDASNALKFYVHAWVRENNGHKYLKLINFNWQTEMRMLIRKDAIL